MSLTKLGPSGWPFNVLLPCFQPGCLEPGPGKLNRVPALQATQINDGLALAFRGREEKVQTPHHGPSYGLVSSHR
jgi:hypothetical protein